MEDVPYTVDIVPNEHGCDVTVTATEGYSVECGGEVAREATLHIRDYEHPMVGRTYPIDGHAVLVRSWRYDSSGAIWVVDDATGGQFRWR